MNAKQTGTQRLLAKALEINKPGTKYGLAKKLGMSQSNLDACMKGTKNLGPKPSILLAEVLDLEPLDVLAVTQADAARTDADKEWWHRKVPRFLSAIALGLILLPGHPSVGRAYSSEHGPKGPQGEPIYIMRTRRKRAA